VSLAGAAYGRIAGHVAHAVKINGEAYDVKPHTGGGKSRLYPRVTRADHRYIAFSRVVFYVHLFSLNELRIDVL